MGSVAIGSNASTVAGGGVAIGNTAVASENAVAIGRGADAQSAGSIAFGAQSSAAANGTSLGFNAKSSANAIALGANAVAAGNNSVALGTGSQAIEADTVSVGSASRQRRIVNVAKGTVSAASTDAVNGAQLFGTTKSVADALGGGAKVNPDGTIDAPAYQIGGTEFNNVGDALTNLDGRTTANTDDIADLRDKLADSGLVDGNGNTLAAVTYDKNADGTPNYGSVSLGGEGATAPVALKNVAAGKDDTDAVNVGQLKNSGLVGDDEHGNLTSLAVTYDDATKSGITLGNTGAPVAIHNVAAGDLSATSTDAVNGSQLFGTNTRVGSLENSLQNGGVIDPVTGQSLAVVYDSAAKNRVTFGGAGAANPVVLSNVAQGVAGTDAVNVDQLNAAVEAGSTANPYIGGRGTGVAARATHLNAVALGLGSLANEVNTISVGNSTTGLQRRITNVQDGEIDSDAATVGQMNSLMGVASTNTQAALNDIDLKTKSAIQDMNSRLDAIGTMAGTDPYVQVDGAGDGSDNAFAGAGSYGVAIGAEASATGSTAIAIGAQSVSSGSGSVALGAGATAAAAGAVAFGSGRATGVNALALGNGTNATGNNAVAAGFNARAAGVNALALGNTARANAGDSLAFGTIAQVDPLATNGIAIGRAANVTSAAQNSVALGSNSVADRLNSISVGSSGQQRQITYVSRGTADTDAVNVSQLKDAVSAFGGNAAVGADGSIVNPTYTVGGTTYHNVGDALNALAQQGGGGSDPLAVTYAANADGSPNFELVTLKGGADGTRLTNVAAGAVNATSKDAINGSQLHGTAQSVADSLGGGSTVGTEGRVTNPTYSLADPAGGAGKVDYDNVGDALANLDGRTMRNTGDIDDLKDQLADSGIVDGNGDTRAVVTYDKNADGTPNYGSVTLGDGNGPVKVTNVANATDDSDAVNLGQLKDSGLVGDDGHGNLTSLAVTYDDAGKTDITLGSTGTPVAIHNVAEGELSATSTDAVNGSQLFATNQDIGDLRDSLQNGGVIDPVTGQSLAVVYDSATKDTVTLGGTGATTPVQLKNVAAGTGDTDAVNVGQLKDSGLVDDDGHGNLTSLAVTYDDVTKTGVTLGNAGTPVAIHNVAAGELSATSTDAVNGSQLFATNTRVGSLEETLNDSGLIDPVTGKSLAVVYDSAAKDTVTLGGAGATTPVQLKNVAAGTDDTDAVNVAQLKDAGLVAPVDPTNPGAGLASLAVTYDKNADDSANFDRVTLKGGANGTTLTNVAAGAVTATSTDAINGSQLHGTAQSVADSLGGGSTVDTNGNVTNPTYSLADPANPSRTQDYHNVGDALANLDGRVVDNTTNITVIQNQLADSGLVDPATGQSLAAVTYDRNADGTPNYGSVTLGNGNGPVRVSNVADGVARHDAVNLGQLQDAGLVAPIDPGNPGTLSSLAVTYGKNTDGSANFDQVVLAGKGGTTISNVKAGAVNAASTDAVNGAQLHGVAQSVADSLGGGSAVDADGKVTSPTYVVNNQTFNNVGDAITNISNSLADGSIGLVQQDETTRDITVAKDTDGTLVNFAGTAGDRVLTGVAAGAVNATSHDAINGSQLYGTAQSVADVIGGGTTVDADGKLADTAIEVNGNKYKTVAEAVQAAAQYGATDSLAVRYDLKDDGTPNYGSVTLGGTGAAPVVLTNVADGVNKYDAVNFGQLSELNDKFNGLDDRVGVLEQNPGNGGGGGSGSGDNPYFAGTDTGARDENPANAGTGRGNTAAGSGAKVGGGANNGTVIGSGSNVSKDNGTAIGSGASSTGEGATAIGSGASASGNQSVAIGAGSVANEANTVSFGDGTEAGNRRIVNIADGVNANDAASKGQLDRAVGGLQGQINDVSRNAYSGIAAATALTMIPGVDPGKTLSFGIGGATYKGYQAVAFGGEARITQNLKMKAGVGLSSGGNTVGVGASYQW
ncbi:YadA-like family protein [Burkholderia multivorans]|uniref:YadA-like family protein n=1 Tax=Burkholderia multivorans TaxID=87883 RepID=UPI00215718A6|nr:YadA-like family protein [Burkholderia multivorans]